jgi:hypothetical protein
MVLSSCPSFFVGALLEHAEFCWSIRAKLDPIDHLLCCFASGCCSSADSISNQNPHPVVVWNRREFALNEHAADMTKYHGLAMQLLVCPPVGLDVISCFRGIHNPPVQVASTSEATTAWKNEGKTSFVGGIA